MKRELPDWFYLIIFTIGFFGLMQCHAHGATLSVELGWDANTEPDVKTYKVCYSNYSGNPKKFVFLNCSTVKHPNTTKQFNGLSTLQKWYFRVNASNDFLTSDFSNMVYVGFINTPTNNKFRKVEIR